MKNRASVRIRRAKPSDLKSLLDLLHLLCSIEEDFVFDAKKQCRGLEMLLDHESSVVLVAESENRVVGMCSGQLVISSAEGGYSLLVEDVVVDTDRRGQGIGRDMLDKLHQWAEGHKVVRFQLLADRSNDEGLAFYRQLDWQRTNLICLRKKKGNYSQR